jgi:WD40 repeat protein
MRSNPLLLAILITCLLANFCGACTAIPIPTNTTEDQPTPNPFELTPTSDVIIPVTGSGGYTVAWSPSGKWIAISTKKGVNIYSGNDLHWVKILKTSQAFRDTGFGMHDNLVVMVDSSYTVTTWDLDTSEQLELRSFVEIDEIPDLCPEGKFETYPENHLLVCLDEDSQANLDNIRHKFFQQRMLVEPPESVSADGSLWAIAYNTGHVVVEIYKIANGKKVDQFRTPDGVLKTFSLDFSLSLSADGNMVAIGDYAGHVTVWNTSSQELLYKCKTNFLIKHMSFSPDSQKLALIDEKHLATLDLTGPDCIFFPDYSAQ